MKNIAILLFMIFGMISYSQKTYTLGYMGSGKSTIGKKVSELIKAPLIDLDDYIVAQEEMSIASIFEIKGEIEVTLKIRKYGNDSFDIELNEFYLETKKTSKVLYYIE